MLGQFCTVVGISLLLLSTCRAENHLATETKEINVALKSFLTAFENLDWESFRHSFRDDATVFFPPPEPPQRFEGRDAYEKQFQKVFSGIRSSAKNGPPYHRLTPKDLRIDVLSDHDALVTFTLENEERYARRTIIFTKTDGVWLIKHLHASNVAK